MDHNNSMAKFEKIKVAINFLINNKNSINDIKRILKLLENKNVKEKPVFCWYHLSETHQPYRPDYFAFKELTGKSRWDYIYEIFKDEIFWWKYRKRSRNIECYTSYLRSLETNIKVIEEVYNAGIKYMDRNLGEFIKNIKKISNSRSRNFIIIVTSDHGEEFMEFGGVAHSINSYINQIARVPLIIFKSWSKKQKVIDQLLNNLYIPHAILNFLNIYSPPQWSLPFVSENGISYVLQEGVAYSQPLNYHYTKKDREERYIVIRTNELSYTKFLKSTKATLNLYTHNKDFSVKILEKIIEQHITRQEKNYIKRRVPSVLRWR